MSLFQHNLHDRIDNGIMTRAVSIAGRLLQNESVHDAGVSVRVIGICEYVCLRVACACGLRGVCTRAPVWRARVWCARVCRLCVWGVCGVDTRACSIPCVCAYTLLRVFSCKPNISPTQFCSENNEHVEDKLE